ncbi:uncharacterized protein [Parasteatoda tepidariorum]|uniref:uncharacterized protein n=1 Tax=Parasteatoda tepidariorum TaxID=114398 RepID=UPI0039BCCFE3
MARVLFGATPSPFLLAATLKYHTRKYERKYPLAHKILNSKLYVDDLIFGLDNENQCLLIYKEIKEILREGGFNMRKWKTNSESLQIKLDQSENCNENSNESSKVLGYVWNSKDDTLKLECKFAELSNKFNPLTKRLILKIASKIFDPLGFISPFTLRPKILLQDIWEQKFKWDDPLPLNITKDWNKWCDELKDSNNFELPRFYLKNAEEKGNFQFHCFVDSSKRAYGAVLYIRYTDHDGHFRTSLICSKSRVAPLRKLTLPRLELLSAVIGSRLFEYVKNSFSSVTDYSVRFWTDSMIVLHWIRGKSERLKTFVQNRVTEVRSKTDTSSWLHCPGDENPSDLRTRGESLRNLPDKELWWSGPKWLIKSEDNFPKENQELATIDNEEVDKSVALSIDSDKIG